jgi:hypothetical protein
MECKLGMLRILFNPQHHKKERKVGRNKEKGERERNKGKNNTNHLIFLWFF